MSYLNENRLLLKSLQHNPELFLENLSNYDDDVIFEFLVNLYFNNLEILEALMFYLGQQKSNNKISFYKRILIILKNNTPEIYYYVLLNYVPIILDFQSKEKNKIDVYTSLIHLTNYSYVMLYAIKFLRETNNLDKMIENIYQQEELFYPIMSIIEELDKKLFYEMGEIYNNLLNKNKNYKTPDEDSLNDKIISEVLSIERFDPQIKNLEKLDLNTIDIDNIDKKIKPIVGGPIDEEINDEVEETGKEEETGKDEKTNKEEEDTTVSEIKKSELKASASEFVMPSEYEKFVNIDDDNFSVIKNNKNKDAIIVNKLRYRDGNIEESVDIINNFLRKDKPFYFCNNKSHHTVEEIHHLLRIDRGIKKNLLFIDGMNIANCNDTYEGSICDIDQEFKNELNFKNSTRRFTNKHRIENIYIWDRLFHNIKANNGTFLMDRYRPVIILQLYLFHDLFPRVSKNNDKILVHYISDIMFIGVGDHKEMLKEKRDRRFRKKEEDDYLLFYLFCKYFDRKDIIFSGDNYRWTDNPKGIMLGNKVYELDPFKTNSTNILSTLFILLNTLFYNEGISYHLYSLQGKYIPVFDPINKAFVSGKKLTKKKDKFIKKLENKKNSHKKGKRKVSKKK